MVPVASAYPGRPFNLRRVASLAPSADLHSLAGSLDHGWRPSDSRRAYRQALPTSFQCSGVYFTGSELMPMPGTEGGDARPPSLDAGGLLPTVLALP